MSQLSLVVAKAANGCIGLENRLPWRCPEDLKHFKALTMGHCLIMGRKTFDSIGKALPGRRTIVVTRNANLQLKDCQIAHSLPQALTTAADAAKIFIIGGAEIYAQALPLVDNLYVTEIQQDFAGDAFFPTLDKTRWQETTREIHTQITPQVLDFHFVTYQRQLPNNA